MKNFRGFACFAFALLLTFAVCNAAITPVELQRAHVATGAFGCGVSGATNATPIVITCAAAHNLQDGDQVQVTGVGGNTNANTLAFVKVTGYSATTFGMYTTAALSAGVAGNASYTSGGVVTQAVDISAWSGDVTAYVVINGLTAGKNAEVCFQDSADGFVSDIRTIQCVNPSGLVSPNAPVYFSFRGYQMPSFRVGVTNARTRLYVMQLDGSATVTTSFYLQ